MSPLAQFWISQAIILPVLAGLIALQVWNQRRARRIRAEREARGEPDPDRTVTRVVVIVVAAFFLLAGVLLLKR